MFLMITFYIDSRYNCGKGDGIYAGAGCMDLIGAFATCSLLGI